MHTEHLDGRQDEAFEESDWDDCSDNDIETEIEQQQSKLIEDTEIWKDDTKKNFFCGQTWSPELIKRMEQQQKNNQEKRAQTLNNDCVLKSYRVSIATVAVALKRDAFVVVQLLTKSIAVNYLAAED
uniref:Uncharacterized protein n=1 Tax=Glossina pallidipes TaxID=7398 RepID=A0A1B0A0S7_GLOPL